MSHTNGKEEMYTFGHIRVGWNLLHVFTSLSSLGYEAV